MIDPRTKQEGEDYKAYNRRRWGGDGWTYSLRDRGQQLGLPFGKWTWWPNTLNAHRLCTYLEELDASRSDLSEKQKLERGLELVGKFYELTYERGMNISTPQGAAQALEELDFARAVDAVAWLEQEGGLDKVIADDTHAKRDMDIHGVPYFVISEGGGGSRPVALSGAQGTSAFTRAFRQVAGWRAKRAVGGQARVACRVLPPCPALPLP
mmetsp:Transcript_48585/g.155182  ORF Transcript_48585/g.155182 Transcript_48585/m.155182 type:complete len:210 (-) Transcript_48585:17-646(-)